MINNDYTFDDKYIGATFNIDAAITNPDTGAVTDPNTTRISIRDPNGNLDLDGVSFTKDATGDYHYSYTVPDIGGQYYGIAKLTSAAGKVTIKTFCFWAEASISRDVGSIPGTPDPTYIPTGRAATFVVAADDSSTLSKEQADFVCTGSADEIIINNCLHNAQNGKVLLLEGTYSIIGGIIGPTNTVLTGVGFGTKIYRTSSSSNITLTESINDTITSFAVSDGSRFIAGQTIRIDNEDFYIIDVDNNTLTTITRPHNTSTASSHVNGTDIYFNMEVVRNELQMEGTASGVFIQNLWIDAGRNTVSNEISNGITIRKCDKSVVKNCWVQNSKGIYPNGPDMDSMRGTGIALDDSKFCMVSNNYITKTLHGGISIRNDCSYNSILDNYIWECDWEGIVVCNKTSGSSSSTGEGCTDININFNTIWDCGYSYGSYGIFVEDQATSGDGNPHIRINIQNNIISKITYGSMGGITIVRQSGTTAKSLYCSITSNLISGVDYDNITLNRANHCNINNNTTNDSTLSNIYISNCEHAIISNNNTNDGTNHGIGLSNCNYCIVSNNSLSNNQRSQIALWDSCNDNQLSNNMISCASEKKGIELGSSNSLRNQIVQNKILCIGESYAGHGISIVDGANYTMISNNYIVNLDTTGTTPKRGIEMAGSYGYITNNKIRSIDQSHAFGYGIRLRATSLNNICKNNDLRDAFVSAVIEDQGSSNEIYNNTGYTTEKSGTATLVNGQTSIVVTHSLDITPSAGDIIITPLEAWGNMTQYYIDTYTSTQFTIHANIDPGQDVDFAWKASIL